LSKVTFIMSQSDISKDRYGSVQDAAKDACIKLADAGCSGEFELEPFRFTGVGKKYRSEYIDFTKFHLKQGSMHILIECEYGNVKSISGLNKKLINDIA